MRIGRTVPPAAAPISWRDLLSGLRGMVCPDEARMRFSGELKAYFDRRHCYLFSSGSAALTVTLLALKRLYPGRCKVLIPAFTCFSVPSAIVRAGLKVSLCDVAPGSFDFDRDRLTDCLNDPELLCVVPTHLFGSTADIRRLRSLLQGRPIPIVEDAAQALGATRNGIRIGTEGDVSLFSLGRGKALTTVEGGIVLTDDDRIAAAIALEYGRLAPYSFSEIVSLLLVALALKTVAGPTLFWLPKSLPFLKLGETCFDPGFRLRTISGFQSGLSQGWRERLEVFRAARRRNSEYWSEMAEKELLQPYLSRPLPDLIRFPVVCRNETVRQTLLKMSDRYGLGLAPVYPDAVAGIDALHVQFAGKLFPQARQMARRLVTLPVHPFVSARDRQRTAKLLAKQTTGVEAVLTQSEGTR